MGREAETAVAHLVAIISQSWPDSSFFSKKIDCNGGNMLRMTANEKDFDPRTKQVKESNGVKRRTGKADIGN